jgi:hypothetical protein
MKDRNLKERRTVSFQGFNYIEHWNNFRQLLANDPYAGDPMMEAFVIAGWMLMSQLAPAEQPQATRPDCADRLQALVRTPFVLGYIFGAAAAAIDRGGIDHHSSEATSVIVGVHQLVFDGSSFEDCIQLSGRASGDEDFSLGMDAAAHDADAFAFAKVPPMRLSKWLDAQLDKAR